ncbi:MAG: flotillin family protein [Planctomycetes bacterium]|nr:flotillin family protein [Planctomycetota bacterium]MCW8137096.1 flotillin family protein [Planctomycetota bacterium]
MEPGTIALILAFLFFALLILPIILVVKYYRRCPSNKVLVVFGKGVGGGAAKTIHGGAALVWPLIQDYAYLSLEPITVEIDLRGALSLKNIRVNVPSSFTVGIGTSPDLMQNAAERLLGLDDRQVHSQAADIIIGQLRLVIATMAIEQINQDRETFLKQINDNVASELNKIGLEVINVNIRDITDESGYIEAIGKRAASEAVNQARVEVAEQEKMGATGEAVQNRERVIKVSDEQAKATEGKKKAERDQRIAVARLEAEGRAAEAAAQRQQEVAVAREAAQTETGRKEADMQRRVQVADYEFKAVDGENTAKAQIAERNATLAEAQAEATRRGEVARAEAQRAVFEKERQLETARLEKEVIVQEEIDKKRVEIEAEAVAERTRREAKGEADAILMKYEAEAEGIRKVLEAKADGYNKLVAACAERPDIAPTLLLIEKMPELVAEQVKAVQNLKIDKVTVWDSGAGSNGNGKNGTAGFLSSLIGALPPIHELAQQAGVELPGYLGRMHKSEAEGLDAKAKTKA